WATPNTGTNLLPLVAGGSSSPARLGRSSSALHRQAGQVLLLELVAHGGGIVAAAKADKAGAIEHAAILFKALHIGAEITQIAGLAGGVGQHGAGAVFRWAGADLHHPATRRGFGGSSLHAARGQQVDGLVGLLDRRGRLHAKGRRRRRLAKGGRRGAQLVGIAEPGADNVLAGIDRLRRL